MNILKHIKNIFAPKSKYGISGKGQYLLKYLLDVYLNETREDYIQEYEDMINNATKNIPEDHEFDTFCETIGCENKESFKRFLTAIRLCAIIISTIEEKEREKILNRIEDETTRYYVRSLCYKD